jgi:hypothetical protein
MAKFYVVWVRQRHNDSDSIGRVRKEPKFRCALSRIAQRVHNYVTLGYSSDRRVTCN